MGDNNIRSRTALAKRIGMSTSRIYEAFAADWSGTATTTVLAQIAGEFRIPLARLVKDPASRKREIPANRRKVQ